MCAKGWELQCFLRKTRPNRVRKLTSHFTCRSVINDLIPRTILVKWLQCGMLISMQLRSSSSRTTLLIKPKLWERVKQTKTRNEVSSHRLYYYYYYYYYFSIFPHSILLSFIYGSWRKALFRFVRCSLHASARLPLDWFWRFLKHSFKAFEKTRHCLKLDKNVGSFYTKTCVYLYCWHQC